MAAPWTRSPRAAPLITLIEAIEGGLAAGGCEIEIIDTGDLTA